MQSKSDVSGRNQHQRGAVAVVGALAAVLALTSCGVPEQAAQGPVGAVHGSSDHGSSTSNGLPSVEAGTLVDQLAGRKFIATSVTGHELVPKSTVSIEFGGDGTVALSAGCNSTMGSNPHWIGSHLALTSVGWTETGCAPELSDEQDWWGDLLQAGVDLHLEGDTLRLSTPTETVTMTDRRVVDPDRPLQGTTWVQQGTFNADTWSGTLIAGTLHIGDGRIDYSDGLNNYSGPTGPNAHLTIGADTVQVSGDFTASGAGCQSGHTCTVDMSLLTRDFNYQITANTLTVTGPDGSGLDFVAETASTAAQADGQQQLSVAHRAFALAAAHRGANQTAVGRDDRQFSGWPAGIRSVTADVGPGTVTDSNTGHTCESGTIISVRLVGDFDTVTAGPSVRPGESAVDTKVREVDLSVDAATGDTCLIGVRTEPSPSEAGGTVLYSR